ncbi:hypothetical protein TNCV_955791 [Trichonephila clavipes]|nr:hypothetical protein TNCV_955791 [Trichonephila clavipes]
MYVSSRGGQCTLNLSRLKRSPVDVVWKLGDLGCQLRCRPHHRRLNKTGTAERRLSERLLSGASNIRTGFQECDENVEIWMACDAEDWGFQMLNDDEIVTSVLEESDPVDDETDEDENNNNNESIQF